MTTTPGKFIVLEGIDGSGTTTQMGLLAKGLRARGYKVFETHEPSTLPTGLAIRRLLGGSNYDPIHLARLFAIDRLEHLDEEIKPALARGEVVICDRYVVSSWAYQSLKCDPTWVRDINSNALWPDLTLFLDVPAAVGAARVHSRGGKREIFDNLPIQERVRTNYLSIAAKEDLVNFYTVDGTLPRKRVTERLLDHCALIDVRGSIPAWGHPHITVHPFDSEREESDE